MNRLRELLLLVILAIVAVSAFAEGKGSSLTPAEGLDNWKQGLDLGGYKSGKYNLVVEGVDKAGNVTRATPMNIFVDPKSDLPIASIINPTPLARVGGDLNIVGTAADDDGVARVEVSLDGADYLPAEGGEFWSLYLKTKEIPEGRHSLDVRAVDINGLVGPASRVSFDLDLTKPKAAVASPVVGTLVSGQIKLSGTVFDANGVRSLEISQDEGKAWTAVGLKKKGKDHTTPSFSWAIDTRKLGDGPKVFKLRSVDMVGSTATAAYLVFVDNTKPAIEMARPAPGKAVNGLFSVVGAVRDSIGVKRLSYEFDSKEKGDIPLTKGDPYFVKEFDCGKVRGGSAKVTLIAEDTIGNVTRLTKEYRIDREADKPVLRVLGPLAESGGVGSKKSATPAFLREGEAIWGSVSDDDGVSAFRWSLDGSAPIEAPCTETFSLVLPSSFPSGKHVLSLVPIDVNGLAGNATIYPFVLDKGPGSVIFDRITSAKASRDFAQGALASVDSGESLEGLVSAPNQPLSAELSIAGGKAKPLALGKDEKAGTWRFKIPLDRSLPYGFASMTVRVKDSAANQFEGAALIYVTDYGVAREEPGFRFPDPRFGEDGRVVFGPPREGEEAASIQGSFYGGDLAEIRLEPRTDLVVVSYEGRVVTLKAAKEGISGPARILGKTAKGHEFSAGPYVFSTDTTPPAVSIQSPAEGTWFNSRVSVSGVASDGGGVVSLSWRRLPDGASSELSLGKDGSFSLELSAADLKPGPFSIVIEAKDASGNVARAYRGLGADSAGPAASFLAPEKGGGVWGPEDVAAIVSSASGLVSVEYSEDGSAFSPIERKGLYFAHRADFAAHAKAAYRLTDQAGNVAIVRPEVSVASPPARAVASASVSVEPAAGEARVEFAGSAGSLKLNALLPGLSEPDYVALGDTDAAPPERFGTRLLAQGAVSLKGLATVEGQAKSVSISVDGGTSYRVLAANKDAKSAKAALPFSYSLEAAKLPSGSARWTIKVEDFSGVSYFCPLYCLFDAKAPTLELLYPEKGVLAMGGPFPLVLRAEDENGLASGATVVGSEAAAVREEIDVASGGRYFVRMVDPSNIAKAEPQAIGAEVKDGAGNKAASSLKISYDGVADAPKIRLDDLPLASGAQVSGTASDDDGPASIRIAVDGGEAAAFPAGAFAFDLPRLSAGKHVLSLEAGEAESGLSSLKKGFTVNAEGPTLGDFAIVEGKSASPWSPGADFAIHPSSLFSGNVRGGNGPVAVSLSFNGGAAIQASVGKAASGAAAQRFSVPIPAALPYDRVSVEIKAKDSTGLESASRIEFHKILPPSAGSDDAEGIRFADSRIAGEGEGRSFLLAKGEKLVGRFNGRPIKALSIKPASPVLSASFEGSSVAIEGSAEGLVPVASLELETVDGDLFAWGPFSAAADAAPPSLELTSPADGEWYRGEVKVSGYASDPNGVAYVEVKVNGGESQRLFDASAAKTAGIPSAQAPFDKPLSLAAAPDGSIRLDFAARDLAGRESRVTRLINKDTMPPVLAQVEPTVGESVNGLTTFVGEASDSGRLASAVFVASAGDQTEEVVGLASFSRELDLVRLALPLPEGMGFVVADKAGNQAVLAPNVVVDKEKDKPVVEIQTPSEMEVLRSDFVISGDAYDDDGLQAAYYRIDGGEWTRLDMQGTSFSVAVALKDTTDNEHLVEVKAEDIYGVQGDVVSRKYRISKEEPVAAMTAPLISKPVRGRVGLEGAATDANGIKEVMVSVDNRTSFDKPVGTTSWSLGLDTTTLSDGIHAVAVRPVDGYDTEGFYASMVSVDNTPPKAQMDVPRDGDEIAGSLSVSGRVSDNVALASARIEVAPVGSSAPPEIVVDIGVDKIVQRVIDVSGLRPGIYSVRLVVRDRADNESLASRNVAVTAQAPDDRLSILFPVEGDRLSGRFRVQGRAIVASGARTVTVLADGTPLGEAEPDNLGWYSLEVPELSLADGDHLLKARTGTKDGTSIESPETRLEWKSLGPWVSVDSFMSGKYLPYRPYLKGRSGWVAGAPPTGDKKALAAYKAEAKKREIVAVDVSLDDGRTYQRAKGTESWSFRLETQDYKEGPLHAIVRSSYADGTTADAKGLYFLDKTPPELQILSPTEGGRFNQVLQLTGRAFDQNGLKSVGVALRKGDKASYELPSFIQGLYLDGQVLGATTWAAGAGLTFFGDNVKLQGLYGKAPDKDESGDDESFFGAVYGVKLIANLLYLPFDSVFGPDWSFLSTSLGVGANFTYFSETQSGSGLIVGSVFGQVEFPKITLKDWSIFKKFSLYGEYQIWVLSSVVDGGFIPKASIGARIGVF